MFIINHISSYHTYSELAAFGIPKDLGQRDYWANPDQHKCNNHVSLLVICVHK